MSSERLAEIKRLHVETAGLFRDEAADLILEIDHLRTWIADLQSGMYINCVYCGHRYGPNPGTPVAMADVLKEHIVGCPQHPLSAAGRRVEILKRGLYAIIELDHHDMGPESQATTIARSAINEAFPIGGRAKC